MYIPELLFAHHLVLSTSLPFLQGALMFSGSTDIPVLFLTLVNGKRHRNVKQTGKVLWSLGKKPLERPKNNNVHMFM